MKLKTTIIAAALIVFCGWLTGYLISQQQAPLPVLGNLQDFSLTTAENKPLAPSDLSGTNWLVNTFFTSCSGPCPALMAKTAQLSNEFKSESHLKFLSLSVDPDRDSPQVLAEYGQKLGATPPRWILATGGKGEVNQIISNSFKLAAFDDPQIHSLRYMLVDSKGQVRGSYLSGMANEEERMRADIRQLLASGD